MKNVLLGKNRPGLMAVISFGLYCVLGDNDAKVNFFGVICLIACGFYCWRKASVTQNKVGRWTLKTITVLLSMAAVGWMLPDSKHKAPEAPAAASAETPATTPFATGFKAGLEVFQALGSQTVVDNDAFISKLGEVSGSYAKRYGHNGSSSEDVAWDEEFSSGAVEALKSRGLQLRIGSMVVRLGDQDGMRQAMVNNN